MSGQIQELTLAELPTHQAVAKMARQIWLSAGPPRGLDHERWRLAEELLLRRGMQLAARIRHRVGRSYRRRQRSRRRVAV